MYVSICNALLSAVLIDRGEQLVSLSREDFRVKLALVSLVFARRPDGHKVAPNDGVNDRCYEQCVPLRVHNTYCQYLLQ
jgi:hypothetical protein